jgi:ferredoxin
VTVEIYYFSGTGNSLFVARDIAEKTNGQLIPMQSVIDKERIEPIAEMVGIVFPVYYATNDCGIPLIVERFVGKLDGIGSKYIFAICTCGNMPGTTIENLRKAIRTRGNELAAGFTMKMANKRLDVKKQQKMSINQKKKLKAISEFVAERKKGKFETRGTLRKIFLTPLLFVLIKPAFSRRYRKLSNSPSNLSFSELIPLADQSFRTSENCNGCGTCSKVCPVNNIEMVDKKPLWQHHCETCLACYSWCPQEAIYGKIISYNERYHHPEVKLSAIIGKNHS